MLHFRCGQNFSKLVRETENGKTVELTRYGAPVAVLMGHRLVRGGTDSGRGFAAAYRDCTRAVDLAELDFDPDELFEGVRDTTSGRSLP